MLHKVRQPALRRDVLFHVCEEVLGRGPGSITDERWDRLITQTEAQQFGRFDGDIFVTYAPYLERDDVVKFKVDERHVEAVAAVLLRQPDPESVFYLALASHMDWKCLAIAHRAYQRGAELGDGKAFTNLGVLLATEGDRAGAKRAFQRGMELDDGRAALNLGGLLMVEGDANGAEGAFRRAEELGFGD